MSDSYTISSTPTVRDIVVCGEHGLQLLVVGHDNTYIATHSLPGAGSVTIGRDKDSDIRITDSSISRTHALLHLGETIRIEDCGSANGSQVRGQRLEPGHPVELAIGESMMLGTATAIIQRRGARARTWRLWSHSHFEGRLEDECARAGRYDLAFALVHVQFPGSLGRSDALAMIESVTSGGDAVGEYAPGQYQIVVVEAERDDAERVAGKLRAQSPTPRVGVACYPEDGRDAHGLSDRARSQARGDPPESQRGEPFVVGGDQRMRELRALVDRVAAGDISVLLLGESGVGKEVFARTIHTSSPRAHQSFLALNCGAFTETLLESELFGHKRGAFTGADRDKPGLLEQAQGGTVFLDEIGELPLLFQVKLLRVLQEREVRRVGDDRMRPIDVRFVCATNRNLEAEIENRGFREDLYYRINGCSVVIPPLRERVGEIEPLARHFVSKYCQRCDHYPEPDISPAALRMLLAYRWPGNIRELRNVMERAVLLCTGESIEPQHLPLEKIQAPQESHAAPRTAHESAAPGGLTPGELDEIERIKRALEQVRGNQTKAAELLGVSRRTLINWLDRYNLPRPRKHRRRR